MSIDCYALYEPGPTLPLYTLLVGYAPYSLANYPDNCFDCGTSFDYEARGHLPFYTVILNCRMKRCCPLCFPKHSDHWMI